MTKTGLIGNGYWGKILEEKLNGISELVFVQTSNNYDPKEFKKADWIFIATPKETHLSISQDCLHQGVNVFLEKPATNTADEYLYLIEIANRNKVKLFVNNVFLHRQESEAIMIPVPNNIAFVWYKGELSNGSIVDDLLYHDLYLLLRLIDQEKVRKINIYDNEPDRLFFSLTLEQSKTVYFDYRREQGLETKKVIHFGEKVIHFPKTQDDPLKRMIIDCILGNVDFKVNFELNLHTISLMEIIKQHLQK